MSETERLRRMLDERGVEWWEATPRKTKWNSPIIGGPIAAREWNGKMVLDTGYIAVTPAQAIAATLGAETCHTVAMDCFGNPPYNMSGLNGNSTACGCSECGAPWSTMGVFRGNQLKHNFKACPICGRKVVDE